MDQIMVGKFIAESRKAMGYTQKRLGDVLGISDKTVSKWETGKGLPEVSLMLPLCKALNITVNDLLSGEKIPENSYKEKAEENMMSLMNENRENKIKMTITVICAVVTVIAAVSLGIISALVPMSEPVRILIVVFAVVVTIVGLLAACVLELNTGYYECPKCGEHFVPTFFQYFMGMHTLTRRMLKCPKCNKTSMCKHIITKK